MGLFEAADKGTLFLDEIVNCQQIFRQNAESIGVPENSQAGRK
jgi:hypothetical protein